MRPAHRYKRKADNAVNRAKYFLEGSHRARSQALCLPPPASRPQGGPWTVVLLLRMLLFETRAGTAHGQRVMLCDVMFSESRHMWSHRFPGGASLSASTHACSSTRVAALPELQNLFYALAERMHNLRSTPVLGDPLRRH